MTNIDFKALYEQDNDLYRLYEVMQQSFLKEPEKPVKPTLPKNHTSTEVQIYQLDLQKYELLNNSYEEELKRVEEHNEALNTNFEYFLRGWSGCSSLTDKQYRIIAGFYYEYLDGHYAGVVEDYVRKKDIIDLIQKFNQS